MARAKKTGSFFEEPAIIGIDRINNL